MKKKLAALLLAVSMVSGLVACGNETEEDKASVDNKVESTTEKVETSQEEPVELRLIMYGDLSDAREKYFTETFHDVILEELNIDLSVNFYPWGAVTAEVATMLQSGEKFAYQHIVPQTDHASKGLCAEISQEDIDTYLPDLVDARAGKGFDCVSYDGKIYGVPIGEKANAGSYQMLTVRNDILNEVGFDADDITTYEQLMEALAAVKEKYPDMYMITGMGVLEYSLMPAFGTPLTSGLTSKPLTYVRELEEGDKVYSYYESEEFKNICKVAEEWVELGYIVEDNLTNASAVKAAWNTGNCLMYNGVPGNMVEAGVKAKMPETAEIKNIRLGDPEEYPFVYDRDYDWAFSISAADADNTEHWLKLFNWIYESQDNYNFCLYGVEGVDWEYDANGKIKRNNSDLYWDDWFLQANKYHTFDASISEETLEKYQKNDEGAIKSKLAGFTFDSTPVANEKSLLTAAITEHVSALRTGYVTLEDGYDAFLKALKDAGIDKYMEEYQKQFSAWYAENKSR